MILAHDLSGGGDDEPAPGQKRAVRIFVDAAGGA
jgi:hypothetical protein